MFSVKNQVKDDNFMIWHKIEEKYKKYGKIRLLRWFQNLSYQVEEESDTPKESTLIFKDGVFSFRSTRLIEIELLHRLFRNRWLLLKYIDKWKYQVQRKKYKISNVNE